MCSPGWATEAQRRTTAEGSPKGESRPLGKVEIDCRKAAPKEEQVGRACESTERERTSQPERSGVTIRFTGLFAQIGESGYESGR